jgi:hypothetical protein
MAVTTIDGFISPENVKKLVDHFKTYEPVTSDVDPNNDFNWGSGTMELSSLKKYPEEYLIVKSILDRIEKIFLDNYPIEGTFGFKRVFVQTLKKGASTTNHHDDNDLNYDGKFKNEKHYSAILMLNDNYGGGELYFENEGLELKTPPGSLIYFRGDRQTLHGVREITSGERINMVIFFRDYDK